MRELIVRHAFTALTVLAVAIIGTLPVLPGHDIPQHLAYVRLLAAWQESPAAYPVVFAPPDTSNAYATVYVLLARSSALLSPETTLRLVAMAYVALLALAVRALVRAAWDDERTALLAPLAAFNPVLCMGLLPYLLALPPLVAALAAVVQHARSGGRRSLFVAAAMAALTTSFHAVAAAALLFFVAVFVLARRDRRAFLALGGCVAGALVATRLAGGGASLPPGIGSTLRSNVHVYGLIDGTLGTFRISFTHWAEKLDQIAASVAGPFTHAWKVVASVGIAAMFGVARDRKTATVGLGTACAVFAIAAVLAPSAVQVPDDLSLLDFRLLTTAVIIGIVAIPPHLVATPRAFASVALLLLLWAHQLRGASAEVGQTTRLIDRLGPQDTVLALSMNDTSAYLDDRNAILHYAAVYHTVRNRGVTSLFWGRFSPRLPIGYAVGQEPPRPPDWAPWEVTNMQIASYTHVLVRWPSPADGPEVHDLRRRVLELAATGAIEAVGSDGACTLYATKAHRLSATFVGP